MRYCGHAWSGWEWKRRLFCRVGFPRIRGRLLGPMLAIAIATWPELALADPRSPFSPITPQATTIANLFWFILGIAGVIFVGVEGAIIYATVAYRERPGRTPAQFRGSPRLEIAWTAVPALILAVIFVLTVQAMNALAVPTGDPLEITVRGHQWWWEFDYSQNNFVTANEFHVPVGQPVILHLLSDNVIHSLWIPQINGKTDMIPGHERTMWFTPTRTGVFLGQCAEYCGVQHAWMNVRLVVQSEPDYAAWVRDQQQPAAPPTGLAREGEQLFVTKTCVSCHAIAGTAAQGIAGPDLTHLGSRATIGAGVLTNTPENMARWLANPQEVKPGSLMPNLNLTSHEVSVLTAYMESLK